MSESLQQQLLKAGLVKPKQVKSVNKEKAKKQKMVHKGQIEADTSLQESIIKQQQEKAERDLQLNQQQQEKLQQKAIKAQIKQIISESKLPKLAGDDYYNFVDYNKVKRIVVNPQIRTKLANGSLAIVQFAGGYEIVPREVALKIRERSERTVVYLHEHHEQQDEKNENIDDEYAKYKIPDDLMW